MRQWSVAGAIIESSDGCILLVCNQRRDGSHDWSTPGGVIELGEDIVAGLAREVIEETGLVVHEWEALAYTVEIEAPDLGWVLTVEAHRAAKWSGDVTLEDPDGIVIDAAFVPRGHCRQRLSGVARWVSEPLISWLDGDSERAFRYRVEGNDRATMVVHRQ